MLVERKRERKRERERERERERRERESERERERERERNERQMRALPRAPRVREQREFASEYAASGRALHVQRRGLTEALRRGALRFRRALA